MVWLLSIDQLAIAQEAVIVLPVFTLADGATTPTRIAVFIDSDHGWGAMPHPATVLIVVRSGAIARAAINLPDSSRRFDYQMMPVRAFALIQVGVPHCPYRQILLREDLVAVSELSVPESFDKKAFDIAHGLNSTVTHSLGSPESYDAL
jgi:hypothetical protein